ncbi:MAG: iron ABC transporter permease [Oscillospiraceae bacterium]|nr:iron ABC transporter permease [Oscillospiraceae bacterium]
MRIKVALFVVIGLVMVLLSISLGSAHVPLADVFHVIGHAVFGLDLPEHITAATVSIVWSLRLPRVLLAFLAGSALSVSGAVMQSVLQNPLASSYTLGVSSGASLGASLVLFLGVSLPFLAMLTLPILGFVFGLATILLAMAIAKRIDGSMGNQTIILTGIVFSLFVNAITTLLFSLFLNDSNRMIAWQMGSFAMRDWHTVWILAPIAVAGIFFITRFHWELDILSFGEEQAEAIGVNSRHTKTTLLVSSAALTGSTIAFIGVIGFVDLVVPHIVRRLFGPAHRYVIPMSAVIGGALMVLCDLIARTVLAPRELPVGVVTAMIGAPFFAYIYFSKRGVSNGA